MHASHKKIDKINALRGRNGIPAQSIDMISKLLQNHCDALVTHQFLEICTCRNLPPNSLAKLVILMRKFGSDGTESTAELLIKILKKDHGTHCVYHAGSYDQYKTLVKVRKQRKRKNQKIDENEFVLKSSDETHSHVKSVAL